MSTGETLATGELQCDLAVIGGGAGGLAAAVTAAENGVKNIVVLETRRIPGGNAMGPMWIFAVDSPAQKRSGINASSDEYFKRAWDYAHWKNEPSTLRAVIGKTGDNIRWLEGKGLKFSVYPPILHYTSKNTGADVAEALINNCKELGVQLLCETKARKLLTNENGKVTGVLAEKEGNEVRITAKAVVVATGGYGGNEELIRKYLPTYNQDEFHHVGLPHMGEGLSMVTEIGAATEGMGILEMAGPSVPGSWALTYIVRRGQTMWVNKRGERFADENLTLPQVFQYANIIFKQPGKVGYALLDEKIKEAILKDGLDPMEEHIVGESSKDWPATVEKHLQLQMNKEKYRISDSWDEIANWIGTAPEVLKHNIDKYNSLCERGYDDTFVKDKKCLVPISAPPYYALQFRIIMMAGRGGIKVNSGMHVLNRQYIPIPGLYAAGLEISDMDGDTYDGVNLIAHSFAFSVSSGRIAGEGAARFILGDK